MFLNYLAGVVSLVLAVSSFVPWVTIWFYSLKGIESVYGIGILLVGLLGVTVSAFQHLSGKIRGQAFIVSAVISLICEGLYFRKMEKIGSVLNEVLGYLTAIFGQQIMTKIQQVLGEKWSQVMVRIVQRLGFETSLSSYDFVGGGLILAVICSIVLLALGLILEKNKTMVE